MPTRLAPALRVDSRHGPADIPQPQAVEEPLSAYASTGSAKTWPGMAEKRKRAGREDRTSPSG